MKMWLNRWAIGLLVGGAAAGMLSLAHGAGADDAPAPQVDAAKVDPAGATASAEQLKTEAFQAIRAGQFEESSKLLSRAAAIDGNVTLAKMADWSKKFESQRELFQAERQKQFDKAVADIHKLLDHHYENYAIDGAYRAYPFAADKQAFRHEPWIDEIVQRAIRSTKDYEAHEEWFKLLRVYEELTTLDPASPEWKDKLKLVTRRVRLLALYAPDSLKEIREADAKDHEPIDALLAPGTQPTTKLTKSATQPTTADSESFRTDWHELLRGIKMEMLKEAIPEARENYYRDVPLRQMEIGGLNGLKALLTTKGLEKTFTGLADEAKKAEFMAKIDALMDEAKHADGQSERGVARAALNALQTTNAATVELPEAVLVNEFADGAFAELDPFSNMIWPADLEEFEKTTQGEFSGVGIQIQLDNDGSLKVVTPLEDSPAFKAGIQPGDVVTHIEHKNAKGISLNTAVRTITGPSGTPVTLTVRSLNGTSRDYTLVRETIKVASIKGWRHRPGGGWDYIIDPDQKIAYIRLTNFTKTTGEELTKALADIDAAGARGIILDLRANPGGLLNAAVDVCDKFLSSGVIVKTHPDRVTPNAPTVQMAHPEADQCHLPLIVLVNQFSASASEIVSGALKDQKRAMIVGERTFGKGSVQMLFQIADRAAYMKLTTSHYYLPLGRCIHREENSTEWGVEPDVKIEVTPDQMRAVIEARQEMDILRNVNAPHTVPGDINRQQSQAPEHGETRAGEAAAAPSTDPTTAPSKKDAASVDAQLSGALLLMRLQVNGAKL